MARVSSHKCQDQSGSARWSSPFAVHDLPWIKALVSKVKIYGADVKGSEKGVLTRKSRQRIAVLRDFCEQSNFFFFFFLVSQR